MDMRAILAGIAIGLLAVPVFPHDRDPPETQRAQERLEREQDRAAQRAEERAARFERDRSRIEEREVREPAKAAEDLAKLEADRAEDEAKAAEDAEKAEADYEKELADEAEDELEDAAELAEQSDDSLERGSSVEIRDIADGERAEHDERGYPVRRGEVFALDVPEAVLVQIQRSGYRIIERTRLEAVDRDLLRLAAPSGTSATLARDRLRELAPGATVDVVHYYGMDLTAGRKPHKPRERTMPTRANESFSVGVIDTAVLSHQALAKARIIPWSEGATPQAQARHGTAVASLLASAGRPTIYSANIFRGPVDRPYTSAEVIAAALEWTLLQSAPVINMSLAGPRNAILDRLIRDAVKAGKVVVAAAGNGGPTAPPSYPAAVPGVIAVTAVDKDRRVYRLAQRGRHIAVASYGVDVLAAEAGGNLARFTGTSFATPVVSAWLGRCRATGADASACRLQLRKAAKDLGAQGFDETYGFGLIE
ncbi:S8 family serine peptidase [Novosphingobium subterraneum]|uniref:S8 family serine peptidase n=1 Tax=Novosphingobium subterraneum TaxID=48936 RepID=UPI003CFC8BE5